MIRRAASVAWLVALATFLLPAAALAATVEADASDYPAVRAIFVTDQPTVAEPKLTENGEPVSQLVATNLGRAKSIVLAVDRSKSMDGQPLTDAVEAARAFVAAKPPEDRISVLTFATEPVALTTFQTSTIDADTALRSISTNPEQGTTLFDALVLGSNSLASETYLGRVIIVVTDGNETLSEATADDAIAAAQEAGASVYVVGIESSRFNPEPLQRIAEETGGKYYGAADSAALDRGLQLDRGGALAHVAPRVRHLGAPERADRPHRNGGRRVRLGRRGRRPAIRSSPASPSSRVGCPSSSSGRSGARPRSRSSSGSLSSWPPRSPSPRREERGSRAASSRTSPPSDGSSRPDASG